TPAKSGGGFVVLMGRPFSMGGFPVRRLSWRRASSHQEAALAGRIGIRPAAVARYFAESVKVPQAAET
ncbi:hypothetical protein V5F82_09180, partial [Xanthobacter flavus]